MHILTKVFVVLSAVMALALSAVTMMYAVNAETIRGELAGARATADAAIGSLGAGETLWNQERTQLTTELAQAREQITSLQGRFATIEDERNELARERARLVQESERANERVETSLVTVDTQSRLLDQVNEELTQLRSEIREFQGRRLELEDELADRLSEILVLDTTVRALREQIADLQRDIASAGSGGASIARGQAGGSSSSVSPIIGPAVLGRVERVERRGSQTFVRISLGRNDRMRENAEVYIVRGSTFVANVRLREVDLQESVGEVTLLGEGGGAPRPGDTVTTSLRG